MTNSTFIRHLALPARHLGIGAIFSQLVETVMAKFAGTAAHRANRLTAGQFAAVTEAAAVRQMADEQRHRSPGFAADLYAAADRHERKVQG